jgi:hypothetical protein
MKELFYEIWQTYLQIAPYLFIGLTFAGLLHLFFKKDFIAKHLGQNNFLAVMKAAVLGVPLPLCSCGVIPTALYLKREKASNGATLSFLISTPQTGVDSIIATYGMMGPVFAIFRPIAAFITGIVGGIIANVFHLQSKPIEPKPENCESGCCAIPTKSQNKFQKFFNYAYREFLDDIALQLVVGIILAGMISYFVPADFFAKYGGDSFVGMLLMIIVGIPLYVCATGSIPIAVSLILKGISPGAAFVFLVVGPATNAATITLIGNAMGKKIVMVYLSVIVVFAILGGYALNFVMKIFTPDFAKTLKQTHAHSENSIILIVITIIFSVLLVLSIYRRISAKFKYKFKKEVKAIPTEQIVKIEGMTCNHCVMNATKAIEAVDGVTKVKVLLDAKKAIIEGGFDLKSVKTAIENAGYSVKE